MSTITDYDMDIARETRAAIRAQIARNTFARELNKTTGTPSFTGRIDSVLVHLGDRASTRQARRQGLNEQAPRITLSTGNGVQHQGR